jgi:hypothetical protein
MKNVNNVTYSFDAAVTHKHFHEELPLSYG